MDLARAFLDGGAGVVQIRAKHLPSGPLLRLVDEVLLASGSYRVPIIVNDRVDVALISGAAGAHVGQDDLGPADARRLLGLTAIVGYSTHSRAQVELASTEPVSYIAIGPVFGTRTRATGYDPLGLSAVTEAARAAKGLPIVAIGGITLETAPDVVAAGASVVAVIGDLLVGGDPVSRVAAYGRALR